MKYLLHIVIILSFTGFSSAQELVINGDFELDTTGFTSEIVYNPGCFQYSYSVEKLSSDKCGSFSYSFTGANGSNDHYMVVDGPNTVKPIWKNTHLIYVEAGRTYDFSFAAASFNPSGSYNNLHPSFDVQLNGVSILSVNDTDIQKDVWNTFTASSWTATTSGPITIEIIQSNAVGGLGYDYCIDNISLVAQPVDDSMDPIDISDDPIDTFLVLIPVSTINIELILPNIFTPNNDQTNDLLTPIVQNGIATMHTQIFNRWGVLLHETDQLDIQWQGSNSPDGVYYYLAEYIDINYNTGIQKGFFTLHR